VSRPALLVAAALLVGSCRTASEAERIGSPGGSVAGTETRQDPRSSRAGPSEVGRPGLATSLIAVATTNANEAQPCERMCGTLGDCLLADPDYTSVAAGGLELQCLDMCVHSPDGEPAKTEFLACGGQVDSDSRRSAADCDPLQACAERTWAALAASRRGPEVSGVAGVLADSCELGCKWMYSCMSTNMPPGEAYLNPDFERSMNENCINQCEHLPQTEYNTLSRMPSCLAHQCSMEGVYQCWEE
jgi:hypothetical protein